MYFKLLGAPFLHSISNSSYLAAFLIDHFLSQGSYYDPTFVFLFSLNDQTYHLVLLGLDFFYFYGFFILWVFLLLSYIFISMNFYLRALKHMQPLFCLLQKLYFSWFLEGGHCCDHSQRSFWLAPQINLITVAFSLNSPLIE